MSFPASACQNCGRVPTKQWRELGICLCNNPKFLPIKWHIHNCPKCSQRTGHKAACTKPKESLCDDCNEATVPIQLPAYQHEDEVEEEQIRPSNCKCGYSASDWSDYWHHIDLHCPILGRCPDCKKVILKTDAEKHWEVCRPFKHAPSSGQQFRQGGLCNGK
jgi:hypothetical protein